jgi:hypothetical protein
VKWDKIEKEQYKIVLEENMKDVAQIVQIKDDKLQNIDSIITEFSNIMVKTAEQLCPKRKCKKNRKRDWTPDMTSIMKRGKFYHWKWKQEGNIDNRESANYKNMRERRLAAAKRDNTYTRIMNLNERNDKQFFALVNRQRCVRSVNTPILKIDDKTFNNPVTVLGAWADYFEDLTTPSEQQSFDSTFLALVNDDVDILTEIFTKNRQPMHEVTEEELSECISTFKNGKAPDEEFEIGKIHNIWKSCGSDLFAVKRACVKSKIVCGTYTLQADRARFNGLKTTSRCPLCFKEPEDTKHFLLKCIILSDTRSKFIKKLRDLLELKLLKLLVFELFECDDNLLQLIVDCTKFHFLNELYTDIERLTSSMCFALHLKRSKLIG